MVISLVRTSILAQAAQSTESAPWWGVPVIAGGFLILGALLGFFFNLMLDARKSKRESARKWDERILELTTEINAKVDQFCRVAIEHGREADARERFRRDGVIRMDETPQELIEVYSIADVGKAFLDVTDACRRLELVAPRWIRTASADMRRVELSQHPASGYEAMAPIVAALDDKRRALEAAIRKHFGIK